MKSCTPTKYELHNSTNKGNRATGQERKSIEFGKKNGILYFGNGENERLREKD